ncbi:division/cell wall cluster transcriptional repressor MraZ [bacterium]|nr:division/cell wall cluster transcriptional repressor MraZ [candidate division CSSED10-310 bacterium]
MPKAGGRYDMFSGRVRKQLDKKGRIVIPKRYRSVFLNQGDERLALLVMDGCIQIYPWHFWERIQDEILALPPLDPRTRELQRIWGGVLDQGEIDAEGRIKLDEELKREAHIVRDVVLVGAINKVEVWDPETYERYRDGLPSPEEVGRQMSQDARFKGRRDA